MRPSCASLLICLTFLVQAPLGAQGPLTPPGAPARTMKTLDQVEARTPIDLIHAPPSGTNAANDTFTITQAGSYYLTSNLVFSTPTGIEVTVSGVTIDLNGFRITGISSTNGQKGVSVLAMAYGCMIQNGTVERCAAGISSDAATGLAVAQGIRCQRVLASNCGIGFQLYGHGCALTECTAYNNLGYGFYLLGGGAVMTNCESRYNSNGGAYLGGTGATAQQGSLIQGCVFTSNAGGFGLQCRHDGVKVVNCTATANSDAGFDLNDGSSVVHCVSRGNGTGIALHTGSSARGCTVQANNGDGITAFRSCEISDNNCANNGGAGIRLSEVANRIDGNHVSYNATGILTDAGAVRNLIVRNSARSNTANYTIVAGNRIAQIRLPALNAADIADANNGSTDGFSGVDPWANFTF